MQSGMMFVLGTIALAAAVGMHAQSGASTLKKVKDYDLSGPPGKRFDYLTIDTTVFLPLSSIVLTHHEVLGGFEAAKEHRRNF